MATTPFAFFTVPGDSPQATKPVADHILKLEAEVSHLRGLLTPGLNTIDARMAALRAELKVVREDAMHVKIDRDKLRSMVTLGVSATDQKMSELRADRDLLRAERDLLRAQLAKVVQERDAARAQHTALQQSAARAATLSRTLAEDLDTLAKVHD